MTLKSCFLVRMATRKFNQDDLEDYDDAEYYEEEEDWEETERDQEEYNIVDTSKTKKQQSTQSGAKSKQPEPQKAVPKAPTLSIPLQQSVPSTTLQGFTLNQQNKLRSFASEIGAPYPLSTWFVEKFSKQPNGLAVSKLELEKAPGSPPAVFVVIGHVDAGKSTLMAQLVGRFAAEKTTPALSKQRSGRSGSFNNMAWEMDVGQDERDHGVTIDAKSKPLLIGDRQFVAIDAPGHADYVPSMLLGAMQADAAVLVIDCVKFDSGFSRGGQTKEHVSLIRALGIHQLVVVLNKIDAIDPEDRFEELETIKAQLRDFVLGEMRFSNVDFVPLSAIMAQNIFEPLYPEDAETLCLVDALLKLKPKPHGPMHHSVCIPIADVNGDKISGRVECGSVHEKERLLVLPSRQLVQLLAGSGDRCPGSYLEAVPFTFVDTSLTGSLSPTNGSSAVYIHPGSVLVDPLFALQRIECVESFHARILVINDDFMPIVRGQSVTINVHTAMVDASIARIVGKIKEETSLAPAKCLVKGDVAIVEISLRKGSSIVIEPDCSTRVTGRVVIRDRGITIAAGLIVSPPSH